MTHGMRIESLSVNYGETKAVQAVSLDIDKGEVLALVGPSGCGKSTLLRAIAGLVPVSQGRIEIGGRDVTGLDARHRNIGLVPQHYAVFRHLSVAENIAYGLRARRADKAMVRRRVNELLDLTQLGPYAERRPGALSGGQRQRVALARALAIDPDVVLLDEPLSALDPQLRGGLRRELARVIEAAGCTTILVTHDQSEAMALGKRIAVLKDGRLIQHGDATEVWRSPSDPFVADFLAGALMLDVVVHDDEVLALEGQWRIRRADVADHGDGATSLLLRPDSLEVRAEPAVDTVEAEVLGAEFAGDHVRLRVDLGDGVDCDVHVEGSATIGPIVHLGVRSGAPTLISGGSAE